MALDVAAAVTSLNVLTAKFDNAARAFTPFYPRIAMVRPSKRAEEDYGFLGAFPRMKEWLGERRFETLRAVTYNIKNRDWEDSLLIDRNKIEDDTLNFYDTPLEQLGMQAAKHPDNLMFQLLLAGAGSTLGYCFDGQYFFDTDHLFGDSGVQSNALTPAAASTSAPTAAEFKTAFNAAVTAMFSFKADNGEFLHDPDFSGPADLMVVVPMNMLEAATTALNAVILNATENIKIATAEVRGNAYLNATPTKWFLFKTNEPIRPFIFQARRPLSRQMKGLEDREFKDVKFMCDARYNVGYGAWWNAIQNTFT